jgi:thiamine biosynthesis lipoprotein ApbE
VRSLGENGWEVDLAGERSRKTELLRQRSIGGSGTNVQGAHIVDPLRKTLRPLHRRAWAMADTAAVADALSTAAMTMTDWEIRTALSAVKDGLGEVCVVTVEPWAEGALREIAVA